MFKKIDKFEGVIEVGGRDVQAVYDNEGLTLKVDPSLAMDILAVLAKAKLASAPPKPQAAPRATRQGKITPPAPAAQPSSQAPAQRDTKPETPPAKKDAEPVTVQTGRTSSKDAPLSNPPRSGEERKEPAPKLETPDELRARREAAQRAQTEKKPEPVKEPEAEAPAEPASEEEPQDRAPLPDAADAIDKKNEGAFVEDFGYGKAIDAAKLVSAGKGAPPEQLLKATKLRDVLEFMVERWKISDAGELHEAAEAWQAHVPTLSRIDKRSLKQRIATTFEAMSADSGAA